VSKDWIIFLPSTKDEFSESFKVKMSESLYPQIYNLLKIKILENNTNFALLVGATELNLVERDNYIFINAIFSTESSVGYELSVCWASKDFDNPLLIHKSDITEKDVRFSWCNDFPSKEIINQLQPWKIKGKKDTGLNFEVIYYIYSFPDILIYFEFIETPSELDLIELHEEVKKYQRLFKTIFVHELFKDEKNYFIAINHNTIDYDHHTKKDILKHIDNLDFLLKSINDNPKIKGLKRIIFK
jgi:hypothetical protein